MSTPRMIDGVALAAGLMTQIRQDAVKFHEHFGRRPTLAVVHHGDHEPSVRQVDIKHTACREAGVTLQRWPLGDDAWAGEAVDLVDRLAADATVDAIFLQYPLPREIDEQALAARLPIAKDVDGVSPASQGALAAGDPWYACCTAKAVQDALEAAGLLPALRTMQCLIVGAWGMPERSIATLLLQLGASVQVLRSDSDAMPSQLAQADLLVACRPVGRVLDVGMFKRGLTLVDAMYWQPRGVLLASAAEEQVGVRVPHRRGLGPLVAATLLRKTVDAAWRKGIAPRVADRA